MTDAPSDEFTRGQLAERERFAEYLAHFEKGSRELAEKATTDESRIYQTTIANAMKAMQRRDHRRLPLARRLASSSSEG